MILTALMRKALEEAHENRGQIVSRFPPVTLSALRRQGIIDDENRLTGREEYIRARDILRIVAGNTGASRSRCAVPGDMGVAMIAHLGGVDFEHASKARREWRKWGFTWGWP